MIVGLTGGIATGKSTVTRMFRDLGAYVVDADVWARKVVEPGQPALAEIVDVFGLGVLHPDGSLNRKALGAIIFHDEARRTRLNEIIHPRVRRGMKEETEAWWTNHPDEPVIWDVPLLFEGDTKHMVDRTILVYVDEKTQLRRLVERDGLTEAEAAARIAAQWPIEKKRELANDIIDNRGSLESTREQVRHLWDKLYRQSAQS